MPTDIKQTRSYVWSTNDVLGKGATGVVYQGIHRGSGKCVAIKTFNNFYGDREFDVLKKINHENIVKLLAVEAEEEFRLVNGTRPKRYVIVTELCQGGCLNNILDEPENVSGLDDPEFLLVLSHLNGGMKYLRDNDIVHRDLKPGNIMKFIKDDGTSVYKLIDFGAARELPDEKGFQSLYGTEEYLCPDMYERALLGVHAGKTFRATVDLWSIGVTLYHVATGELPFRPFGGRRNRETMHYITTKKATGVISGVQHNINGPIHWSTDLPAKCLLSAGLKKIIIPLIAGLLESENSKIWSFERFFNEVNLILSRKVVNIFQVNTPALIKVYLKPDEDLEDLQEDIYAQTGLARENQILIYKSALLKAVDVPTTSEDCPLFLFSKTNDKVFIAPLEKLPQTIAFSRNMDTIEDAKHAKMAGSVGHEIKRTIEKYALHSKLLCEAVENLSNYVNFEFNWMDRQTQHLRDKLRTLERAADIFEVSRRLTTYNSNTNLSEELKQVSTNFINATAVAVTNLYDKHIMETCLRTEWDAATKEMKKPSTTRATKRAKILIEQLEDARLHLKKGRNYPLPHENQYLFDRKKIGEMLAHLVNLLQIEVYPQYKVLFQKFEDWYKMTQVDYLKIGILTDDIKEFGVRLEQFEKKLEAENNEYNEYLKSNPNATEVIKYVKVPQEKPLDSQFKNRLKAYNRGVSDTNSILAENAKLRNILSEYTSDLSGNKLNFEG